MRRITTPRWLAAIAAAALLALAGCGGSDSSGSSTAATSGSTSSSSGSSTSASGGQNTKVKKVAFFGFAASNSFAQATWAGVQEAAKKYGVEAKFFDPNFDAQKQVSQIQDAMTTGDYQVFVVQANDGNAVVPAVKQAIDQGITVVGEFTTIGTDYASIKPQVDGEIYVGEAPVINGQRLAGMAIDACKGLNPCNVAYLQGSKALPLDNARTDAVMQKLKSASNVTVVASPEGGYTQASGLKATQDVLTAHRDVNVIIGSSQAIEGGQQAVAQINRLPDSQAQLKDPKYIKLIGNGAGCQAIKAVKDWKWYATYVIPEKAAGEKATELGIQAANGEQVPDSFDTSKLQDPLGTRATLLKTNFKADYCD